MKKYINQQDMKQANTTKVFSLIRKNGCLTRKQIEAMTNLSWGTVSNITTRLMERQYIKEFKMDGASGAGRIPSCLEVNGEDYFVIGMDINASGFRGVVLNLKNEILVSRKKSVEYTDRKTLLAAIFGFAREVLAEAGDHQFICIGIAMQGIVDAKNGISRQVPGCKDWLNVPLAELLEEEVGIPVYLEHDPNCSLYAYSVDHEIEDAMLIRVDKGVGMAVMLDGAFFDRPGMFEFGHSTVVPDGIACSCGKKGCMEAYVSSDAMSRRAGVPFDILAERARTGEEQARKLFSEMAGHLALGIVNLAHMLCIRRIVLCGDMWLYKDIFLEDFQQAVRMMEGKGTESKTQDTKKQLDFSIMEKEHAAIGAALLAGEYFMEQLQI